MSRLITHASTRHQDPFWPVSNERGRNPALVLVLLVESEWSVANHRPTGVIGPIGFRIPGLEVTPLSPLEGASPVVGTKENHGIVQHPLGFQVLDQAPHILVQNIDHRCENLHPIRFPLLLLPAEALPIWNVGGTRTEFPLGGNESVLELTSMALRSHHVPSTVIESIILFHRGLRGLQGVVGRIERRVEQERLIGRQGLVQEFESIVHDRVGGVKRSPVELLRNVVFLAIVSKRPVTLEKIGRPR